MLILPVEGLAAMKIHLFSQMLKHLKSMFIEDNIFIHILFTILKNKTERHHLNKISHRETKEQNMGESHIDKKKYEQKQI